MPVKVQKIRLSDGTPSWTVLDANQLPILPIAQFLQFLLNAGRSINTIRTYAHHLQSWWLYLDQSGKDWKAVNLAWLADFIDWLRRPPDGIERESARKPSTLNAICSAVIAFYDYHERMDSLDGHRLNAKTTRLGHSPHYQAFLKGIAPSTTAHSAVSQRVPEREIQILTANEVQTLIEACQTQRDRFLLTLLYQTGMRIGQALGLQHQDIESWHNLIRVVPRMDNANLARAKTFNPYTVHVSETLMAQYSQYLVEEYPPALDTEYVFVMLTGERKGRPLTYQAVRSLFKRLGQKTGITTHPHSLRHTHITELVQQGVDLTVIQKRVGHQSLQTTIQTYTHLTDADMEKELKHYLKSKESLK
jgi:integrase/recombinase XerD